MRELIQGPLLPNEHTSCVRNILSPGAKNILGTSLEIINSTYFPQYQTRQDSPTWKFSSKGVFTTSSAYRFLTNKTNDTKNPPPLFTSTVQTKSNSSYGYANTKDTYLASIGIDTTSNCSFCNSPETVKHIFLECSNVKKLWRKLGVMYHVNLILSSDSKE